MQLQDQLTPESKGLDGVANSAILQPVYPFVIGPEYFFHSIVTRTTIPLVTTAKLPQPGGGTKSYTGLGDTTIIAVPVHRAAYGTKKGEFYDFGPVLATQLPTATSTRTGGGTWNGGIGPLGLINFVDVFTGNDSLLVGGFGYNVWDIAPTRDGAGNVSKAFFAPVLVYHFEELFGQTGWYTAAPDDLWEYDWKLGRFITAPVGARLGKVFAIGKQPVNMFFQGWWNAANALNSSNVLAGPEYTFKLNITFLFSE